jgi:hypothetical protein
LKIIRDVEREHIKTILKSTGHHQAIEALEDIWKKEEN